jgi:hypothetical protein
MAQQSRPAHCLTGPEPHAMHRRHKQAHRCVNKPDQPLLSSRKARDHTAQTLRSGCPRKAKPPLGPAHPSPKLTPEPDEFRLTPASMRTDFIDCQQLCEQLHGETPASDATSQPVQPIHSLVSGDSSSCTVSATVRVPTSPDEDNTAQSPSKALPGLRQSAEEPYLAPLPLQTILENNSAAGTDDFLATVRVCSCP